VPVNQAFDRTLNSIDSARIDMAVGFFCHQPSLSGGERISCKPILEMVGPHRGA
jgi:hypothetical protein